MFLTLREVSKRTLSERYVLMIILQINILCLAYLAWQNEQEPNCT